MNHNKFAEQLSIHHIIGRMNHSWANVEDNTNKMILGVLKHRALNTLVLDKQEPQLQLELFYEKYWKPVLSKQVCKELEFILSLPKEEFYRPELIKTWKRKK